MSRFKHWFGEAPPCSNQFRKWSKSEVVVLRTATFPKFYYRGKLYMLVRYSLEHAGDTLRMWDPNTNNANLS
jgi:hypothetical protein